VTGAKIGKILKLSMPSVTAAVLLILVSGCEDVIQVDLDSAEPRIVIEGYIFDDPSIATVKISRSGDFYDPSIFPSVTGADVKMCNDIGDTVSLDEYRPGTYLTNYLRGMPGLIYTAIVTVDSVTYTASAAMTQPIRIEALGYEYQEGGGFGPYEDAGYRLHVQFTDPEGVRDFCLLRIRQNDEILQGYFLYDGEWNDGNVIDYDYFSRVFDPGDSVYVELITMDEVVFDYFSTLVNVVATEEGGNTQGVPANPNNNWDNDALGYFGAFAVTYDMIIMPALPQ
jgi:hypothetical protein